MPAASNTRAKNRPESEGDLKKVTNRNAEMGSQIKGMIELIRSQSLSRPAETIVTWCGMK